MKLKLITTFSAILLLIILQSCTTPNPYEPVNNGNATGSTNNGNSTVVANNNNNNDDDDDNNGTTTPTTPTTPTGSTVGNTGGTSSTTGANKSHNMGQNCMNCHNPGGSGSSKGVWKLAGTVYNELNTATNSNTTINLFTGPNGTGTLKYILNVDSKGNFYTSGTIDFAGGLYPAVIGATTTNYMSSPITTGACNSCHAGGTSTARIWAK